MAGKDSKFLSHSCLLPPLKLLVRGLLSLHCDNGIRQYVRLVCTNAEEATPDESAWKPELLACLYILIA